MEVSEKSRLSSAAVESLSEDIETLSLPDSTRTDLNDCVKNILTVDFRELKEAGETSNSKSNFNSAVKHLMRFSNVLVKALGATGKSLGPLGTLCKITSGIVGFFFADDITSVVARRFETALDAELRAKCRATCINISHCMNYMQGLPHPRKLQEEEKKIHLTLMAADIPIQTGQAEILDIGEKIRDMIKAAISDMRKFDCLMNNVELYCCLATFREIFLLYRFAFQSLLEVNAQSVRNVLESQVTNDQSVLEFLYKPTVENVKLYYNARQDNSNWPLSKSFCERRGLVVDDLSCLNNGVYKILSVQSKYMVHTYDDSGKFVAYKPLGGVILESNSKKRNIFSIQTDALQFAGMSKCGNYIKLYDEKAYWFILKVHENTPSEKSCYMIWSEADMRKCMYKSMYIHTYPTTLTTSKELGPRFFWTLEPV